MEGWAQGAGRASPSSIPKEAPTKDKPEVQYCVPSTSQRGPQHTPIGTLIKSGGQSLKLVTRKALREILAQQLGSCVVV